MHFLLHLKPISFVLFYNYVSIHFIEVPLIIYFLTIVCSKIVKKLKCFADISCVEFGDQ